VNTEDNRMVSCIESCEIIQT